MKKLVTLLLLTLLPLVASADPVEIDGIYYILDSWSDVKTATVTSNPDKYSGYIVIPSTFTYNDVTYSVTSIGVDAFSYCSGLTSVTIPESMTSIDQAAFYGCSGLTSITIPNSVTSIGIWAFRECSGLTSIVVESGNTVYDSRDNCNAIIMTAKNSLIAGCKTTVIPNSVTSIGDYAFHNCRDLASITIPNSVTSIGGEAFHGTAWYNNQPEGLVYAGSCVYKYLNFRK